MPPHRVAELHVREATTRGGQERMPGFSHGHGAVQLNATHLIVGNIVKQRPQQQVGERFWDGDRVQNPLVLAHVGQRRPPLECTKGRTHCGARVLRSVGAKRRVPRVVGGEVSDENVSERSLVACQDRGDVRDRATRCPVVDA